MTERSNCKCSEAVQTCFCFCVDVLYVLSERYSSVLGHTKCGGVVGVWVSSPFSVMGGFRVYSLSHGRMSVSVNFVVETFSLIVWSYVSSECMYSRGFVTAVSGLGCFEKTVLSSAYDNM